MNYCKRCILPDTRPGIILDREGVCSGCRNVGQKNTQIDWATRHEAFCEVVKNAKSRSKGYDCLIPVSGGKDSTWQVVTCLEHGLKPLALTWRPPGRTSLGQKNLDNLIRLGVDHIDYSISPKVERKFMLRTFERLGSTAIPMHLAIFALPPTIAIRFGIPLIIWGENSAFEYGTAQEELTGFRLDSAWLRSFGVTHGTSAADWVGPDLTASELTPYYAPSDADLDRSGVSAVFLGYYFNWDVETSLRVAKEHGFLARAEGPRTGYYNYADIDDDFISLHHYLKWYKFGMTRTWDNLSIEIRNGRMTREQAIEIIRRLDDETPVEDIRKFCSFAQISEEHFFDVAEKFRNHQIWKQEQGVWKIPGFLIMDWKWK